MWMLSLLQINQNGPVALFYSVIRLVVQAEVQEKDSQWPRADACLSIRNLRQMEVLQPTILLWHPVE
jgi:hypothetical protein